MAVRMRFELMAPCGAQSFQDCAIGHSAISPLVGVPGLEPGLSGNRPLVFPLYHTPGWGEWDSNPHRGRFPALLYQLSYLPITGRTTESRTRNTRFVTLYDQSISPLSYNWLPSVDSNHNRVYYQTPQVNSLPTYH